MQEKIHIFDTVFNIPILYIFPENITEIPSDFEGAYIPVELYSAITKVEIDCFDRLVNGIKINKVTYVSIEQIIPWLIEDREKTPEAKEAYRLTAIHGLANFMVRFITTSPNLIDSI